MLIVLKLVAGELTNKPYRIVKVHFGVGVESQNHNGKWIDSEEYFESMEDAMMFIQQDDMDNNMRRNESFYSEL